MKRSGAQHGNEVSIHQAANFSSTAEPKPPVATPSSSVTTAVAPGGLRSMPVQGLMNWRRSLAAHSPPTTYGGVQRRLHHAATARDQRSRPRSAAPIFLLPTASGGPRCYGGHVVGLLGVAVASGRRAQLSRSAPQSRIPGEHHHARHGPRYAMSKAPDGPPSGPTTRPDRHEGIRQLLKHTPHNYRKPSVKSRVDRHIGPHAADREARVIGRRLLGDAHVKEAVGWRCLNTSGPCHRASRR
jgi:hypothetical protein